MRTTGPGDLGSESRHRPGPIVVAIGGGRGLTATVAAARSYASFTHAVVSTADDGGSTGRLRRSMPIPAPGDLRRSLVALAGCEEKPIGKALEFRFAGTDLAGHALGNLLLAGLTAVTDDFHFASQWVADIAGVDSARGRVWPATIEPVDLWATTCRGAVVRGQYAISQTPGIQVTTLEPADARSPDGLRAAIESADQIVLGPGSVYTSVLACALVPDIRSAVIASSAQIVYICNLAAENYETAAYDAAACVAAIRRHGIHPEVVVTDPRAPCPGTGDFTVVTVDVSAEEGEEHDVAKLGTALRTLADEHQSTTLQEVRTSHGKDCHRLRFS